MKRSQNYFLIGPMASGKTTIGQLLANKLKLPFYDADQEIERRTGAAISLIFAVEGEAGFRARETCVIDELTSLSGIVLATGGGAILNAANRAVLASRGIVIYLATSVSQQMQRTKRDKARPLLQTENPQEKLMTLAKQRNPLYRRLADLVFVTDNCTAREVVTQILQHIDHADSPR